MLGDLTGDVPIKLGVPSDVLGAKDRILTQFSSEAFYSHPDRPDGFLYPSRLNEERNIALYDRAVGKLVPSKTPRLVGYRNEIVQVISDLELAIV